MAKRVGELRWRREVHEQRTEQAKKILLHNHQMKDLRMSNKMNMVYEKVPMSPNISRKEVASEERLYITRV